MTLGEYCKSFRESKKATLSDLTGNQNIKTLSAFEHDRSTNYKHIQHYISLAILSDDLNNFATGLMEVLNNE